MTPWIIAALYVAIPANLHWRGRGIVGLSFAAACLYGAAVLLSFIVSLIPPDTFASFYNGVLAAFGQRGGADRDTYLVVTSARGSILPMVIFGTICAVFWALTRWGAPIWQAILKVQFWVLYLALLAVYLIAASYFSPNNMPHRYIDEDLMSSFNAQMSIFVFIISASLLCFAMTAFWSAFRKLKL